jgi:hypothetical protein
MAGSTSHVAYRGLDRRAIGDNRDGVCAVVMVTVLVTVLEFGVTEAGLKLQPASAGIPLLHEKLIGLVNEPCGVTVSVNVADCPAVIVLLVGLKVSVKAAAFTV